MRNTCWSICNRLTWCSSTPAPTIAITARTKPSIPIGGHIPGARNRFFKDNLTPQGFFKSPEQLRDEFRPFVGNGSPEKIVSQCGSGVTACHNLLAMEIADLKGGRLYPGSWSEWIADPSRPRAT